MSMENNNCCETAEQNVFTRYQTETGRELLLPYSGLWFADLWPSERDTGILTLAYTTHIVKVKGSKLSPLLLAFQKRRVETIRLSNQLTIRANITIIIREISISERNPDKPVQPAEG